LVDPDLGSNYAIEEALLMLNVALLCTTATPTLRPMMSKVVSLLEGHTPLLEALLSPCCQTSTLKQIALAQVLYTASFGKTHARAGA